MWVVSLAEKLPLPAFPPSASSSIPISASAASATAKAAATAASAAFRLWTGFVDIDGASADRTAIQCCNGFLAVFVAGHFNETEAARTPRIAVCQDAHAVDLAIAFECLPQFIFVGVEAEIPHKNILHASSPALSCWKCELGFTN